MFEDEEIYTAVNSSHEPMQVEINTFIATGKSLIDEMTGERFIPENGIYKILLYPNWGRILRAE